MPSTYCYATGSQCDASNLFFFTTYSKSCKGETECTIIYRPGRVPSQSIYSHNGLPLDRSFQRPPNTYALCSTEKI